MIIKVGVFIISFVILSVILSVIIKCIIETKCPVNYRDYWEGIDIAIGILLGFGLSFIIIGLM